MTRERDENLKFRAWQKVRKYMFEVMAVKFPGNEPYNASIFQTDGLRHHYEECELMQYTGLKDKNGKEIYEGDILDNEAVVCFRYGKFQPVYDGGKAEEVEDDFRLIAPDMEVIGNIYENPELLDSD